MVDIAVSEASSTQCCGAAVFRRSRWSHDCIPCGRQMLSIGCYRKMCWVLQWQVRLWVDVDGRFMVPIAEWNVTVRTPGRIYGGGGKRKYWAIPPPPQRREFFSFTLFKQRKVGQSILCEITKLLPRYVIIIKQKYTKIRFRPGFYQRSPRLFSWH